jgi:hypothetical protein
MNELPIELILHNFEFMNLQQIQNICKTNKRLYQVCKNKKNLIAKIILKNEFNFDFSNEMYCYKLLKLLMYLDYLNVLKNPDKKSTIRFVYLMRKANKVSLIDSRKNLLYSAFGEYCETGNLQKVEILTPLFVKYNIRNKSEHDDSKNEILEFGLLKAIQEHKVDVVKYLVDYVKPTKKIIEYIHSRNTNATNVPPGVEIKSYEGLYYYNDANGRKINIRTKVNPEIMRLLKLV